MSSVVYERQIDPRAVLETEWRLRDGEAEAVALALWADVIGMQIDVWPVLLEGLRAELTRDAYEWHASDAAQALRAQR